MIVGTAGHIDHGKTTLVRALTGVDTDRLREEKERGISIELGYAYTPLANGEVLGFVDVPGHERFVHTMVAGACGIDVALLVIAADDGVMPQTREHLDILQLLGVKAAVVALTKIDRADAPQLRNVRRDIGAALASTPWSAAPVFTLNPTQSEDPGTQQLRQHLCELAGGDQSALTHGAARANTRGLDKLFRLAVDRVFTLAGRGTIATGTVYCGAVHVGDTLCVMPAGHRVRVRSIHAQNRPAQVGRAGQRCALNLVGIEKTEISRGDWLAHPDALASSMRIDARLRLLADAGPGLRAWSPLHFHCGTAHALAHVVMLDAEGLPPGGCARAQLAFAAPVCLVPGDRFIVRNAQATRTIGGGVVLDPFAPSRRRRTSERLRYLDALERMIEGEGLAALLDCAPRGLRMAELARLTGTPGEHIALPPGSIVLDTGQQRFVLLRHAWQELKARALLALREFHAQAPEEPGPDIGRLRRIAAPELPGALWRAVVEELVQEAAVIRSGAWLHLPGHAAELSQEDQALAQRLEPLIAAGRFDPPWVRALSAALHEPEERVREVLRKQVTRGSLYQVVHDLFYDAGTIGELADLIAELAREHGALEAARFRDALGIGRKRAIQILEFFDRIGHTRRVRDTHVLREDSGWHTRQRKAHVPGGATGLQTQEGAPDASW